MKPLTKKDVKIQTDLFEEIDSCYDVDKSHAFGDTKWVELGLLQEAIRGLKEEAISEFIITPEDWVESEFVVIKKLIDKWLGGIQ